MRKPTQAHCRHSRPSPLALRVVFGCGALVVFASFNAHAQAASRPQARGPIDVAAVFSPSGMMGDGADTTAHPPHVVWNNGWRTNCHNAPVCIQAIYTPGRLGWGGMYLQYPDTNWGTRPGLTTLDGYKAVSFWARADASVVVEFKAGGIDTPGARYKDSFVAPIGPQALTQTWTHYEIPLANQQLSNVIGGFAWIATAVANNGGVTFYLQDIRYIP